MKGLTKRKSENKITHEQKWAEISTLRQVHNELMDLACYDPGNVPPRLREFLSQGDIEGADAKAVVERGTIHSWGQHDIQLSRQSPC